MKRLIKITPLLVIFLLLFIMTPALMAYEFTDETGQKLSLKKTPAKVVSLSPSATETICAIKAHKSLVGITYQDNYFEELNDLPIIGGLYTPNFKLINLKKPDLLIVEPAGLKKAIIGRGENKYPILVWNTLDSLEDSLDKITQLGQIFKKQSEAIKAVKDNRDFLETIQLKANKIPGAQKLRTVRIIGGHGETLYAPGESSFQNQIIAAAGGLAPNFGPDQTTIIDREKWIKFNPQFIYGCSEDKAAIEKITSLSGWNRVEAIKNKRISYFPCALTDRASAHTGYFVAWLSSTMYGDLYGNPDNFAYPAEIIGEKKIDLDMPYVSRARVVESRLFDFVHSTLLIDFKSPQTVISTADGPRENITTIGNSGSPPMVWGIHHQGGWEEARQKLYQTLGLDEETSALIFTGANLNNLAVKTASYKDIRVTALITAGVEGNAIRTSRDTGSYYHPGTINIVVLSNHKLSPAGATRAIITITEAKTAALWDMDIRSTQTPAINPATGTGTDDILVVAAGDGEPIDYTGGHAKIGELISTVVYEAIQEALLHQNGLAPQRHIFARLNERGFSLHGLLGEDQPTFEQYPDFQDDLEALLLNPLYQSFLEASFALDDAKNMGQIVSNESFKQWGLALASDLSGRHISELDNIVSVNVPPFLKIAINSLGTGLKQKP